MRKARLGLESIEREAERLRTMLPGEWKLLAETVLTGSTASVTLSSIPGDYRTLIAHVQLRTDRATEYDSASIQFNGDSGNNYDRMLQLFDGAGVAATSTARATSSLSSALQSEGANSRANCFAAGRVFIPGYALTDREKQVLAESFRHGDLSADADFDYGLSAGHWRSTSAITSITFFPQIGPNFVSGCRFTLYGVL